MTPAERDAAVALANLRHAYQQAFDFHIGDQRTYAEHLLGPAIKTLEHAIAERLTCATCRHASSVAANYPRKVWCHHLDMHTGVATGTAPTTNPPRSRPAPSAGATTAAGTIRVSER